MMRFGTRSALVALGLATIAAPALAQTTTVYETTRTYVRPGYGFNGALQQTEAQTAASSPYVAQGYTYVQPGYVVTAPATTYTYVAPAYSPPYAAGTVATAPILDRDTIEDRLDDQDYDDIDVVALHGTYYSVRAEDRDDRKVWLKVDATTGYVLESQPR